MNHRNDSKEEGKTSLSVCLRINSRQLMNKMKINPPNMIKPTKMYGRNDVDRLLNDGWCCGCCEESRCLNKIGNMMEYSASEPFGMKYIFKWDTLKIRTRNQ